MRIVEQSDYENADRAETGRTGTDRIATDRAGVDRTDTDAVPTGPTETGRTEIERAARGTNGASEPSSSPLEAELDALANGALVTTLAGQGRLRLRGADRLDFLHGQVANDVKGLPAGGSNVSLLLNHRGHALAQMRVLRDENDIDLIVEGGARELVEDSLRRHIIFDQVVLEAVESHCTLSVQGPHSSQALGALTDGVLPAEGRFAAVEIAGQELLLMPTRRSRTGGYDLYLRQDASSAVLAELQQAGVVVGSQEALELERVCAGIPTAAGEAGDGILPQEAGLEPYLSYRKGCYLGQEIMARIEARGKLRRGLGALELRSEPGGRDVRREGKPVGKLGTLVRHPQRGLLALAVLRTDLSAGETVEAGGSEAKVLELPIDPG